MVDGMSREELLDKIEESAWRCEHETHGGSGRCTLRTLVEYFELGDESSVELCLKAILPMTGGIAQTRNTCAALLGGIMAIGMASLPGKLEDVEQKDLLATLRVARQFYRSFEKEVGHSRCFDIRQVGLGRCFDTTDPQEYEKFTKSGGYELCSRVCGKAARLAAECILDIREQQKKVQAA